MASGTTTVFNSVHTVAKYLYYLKKDISPFFNNHVSMHDYFD